MSATLNFVPIKYVSWKAKTFSQVTTSIRFNDTAKQTQTSNRVFFKALPLKIHRREIANPAADNSQRCNVRTSVRIDELCRPNGYIVYSNPLSDLNEAHVTTGLGNVLDLQITTDTTNLNTSSCNTATNCINQAAYARRRVRSSGMIPSRKYNSAKNGDHYYTDNAQYLKSRNKLFEQNQYNYLRQGTPTAQAGTTEAMQNVYSGNSLNHCPLYEISTALNNNTFQYVWIDNNTYTVTIPDGYYDYVSFNAAFQSVMIANTHYYENVANKSKVFLLVVAYNLTSRTIQLQCLSYVQYDSSSNYAKASGASWSYVNDAQFIIPSTMSPVLGFVEGSYPPQIPSGSGDYFANSTLPTGISASFVPVYYKPNNPQFSQQGGVSSSSLITRIKYDTLRSVGATFNTPNNNIAISNSLAYATPSEGFIKKAGNPYPVKYTPSISKYTGLLRKCGNTVIRTT